MAAKPPNGTICRNHNSTHSAQNFGCALIIGLIFGLTPLAVPVLAEPAALNMPQANNPPITDLCPNTDNAQSSSNANNLNDVQADIDRLGLCVERAKLLQELDELVTKRQALLTGENAGGNANALALPPLPLAGTNSNQLKAEMPKLDNAAINKTLNRAAPFVTPPILPESITASTNGSPWAIQRIWGQAPNIQAQLIGPKKTIATVDIGEPLTDGYAVESISARGVILSRAGKLINLDWEKPINNTSSTTEKLSYAQPTLAQ